MKHIGLFEGIGGFSIAVKLMGWKTVAWCEWNEFGQKVLRHHFPEAEGFGDITKTDFTKYANTIDILTGGFPCQPYSTAGKRLGKEDERHLWPEMLRAIREIQPCWVIGENVHGLVSWNGGLVFHEVQTDLEVEGYEVWPVILPACAINAPHRRDRVWFVAYSNNARTNYRSGIDGNRPQENKGWQGQPQPEFGQDSGNGIAKDTISKRAGSKNGKISNEGRGTGEDWGESIRQTHGQTGTGGIDTASTNGATANTTGIGERPGANSQGRNDKGGQQLEGAEQGSHSNDNGKGRIITDPDAAGQWWNEWKGQSEGNLWDGFPTQSPLCSGDDGIPTQLDGITFSKWRNESLKAYGNAIVPQVALQILKAIAQMSDEMLNTEPDVWQGRKK